MNMFVLAVGWTLLVLIDVAVEGRGYPNMVEGRVIQPWATSFSKYSSTLCETSSDFHGVCQMNNMTCPHGTYTDGLCRRPVNQGQIPSNGGAIHVSCCIEGDSTGYGPRTGYQPSTTTETPGPNCFGSTLGPLENADFMAANAMVGETVTYTCKEGYRLAPTSPDSEDREQNVTCQSDGSFTKLEYKCVYTYPESCRDYFTRDDTFNSTAITCTSVTIDPQEAVSEVVNKSSMVTVQCCKTSATAFCTQISPSSGSSASVSGSACTGPSSTLMPTTVFTIVTSATCDTPTNVTYPISSSQIVSMIRSTSGTCSQVTSISCTTAAAGMSLALRVNSQPSAFLYGTAIFDDTTFLTGEITLSNYVYAGATCDCATSGVAIAAGTTCASGCQCSTLTAVPAATADTITKYLTAENPQYVTGYQATVHNIAPNPNNPAANSFSTTIGNIKCCETF